ncbi:MAG: hypothetical protein ABIV21_08360 [Pyrinomonadaceae bacterium]
MKKFTVITFCFVLLLSLSAVLSAQSRSTKRPKKTELPAASGGTAVSPAATPTPPATPGATPGKRNSRPGVSSDDAAIQVRSNAPANGPVYSYEFDRPGFIYGHVNIEHDDAGRGSISFVKEGYIDAINDPIELSAVTMAKMRETFEALNFLNSTESYQHERNFANMGNVTITLKKDGRSRTAKYNWTDNKLARDLMDEYRKISNEYTWRFEMTIARANQPLQSPGLMETMDRYISRGEISDPQQLLPLLTQYSTDERLPLMARNRAAKIVKQISKAAK